MKKLVLIVTVIACLFIGCATKEEPTTGWKFECVTEEGKAVAGVKLQLCTSDLCQLVKCDENGIGIFEQDAEEEAEYELHVQKVPSGYELTNEVPKTVTAEERHVKIVFKTVK